MNKLENRIGHGIVPVGLRLSALMSVVRRSSPAGAAGETFVLRKTVLAAPVRCSGWFGGSGCLLMEYKFPVSGVQGKDAAA
jgi:hypothetical protein